MKIKGGSFGTSGHAFIGKGGTRFIIESDRSATYKGDDIASVSTDSQATKQFGCLSFIVGALLFGGLGLLILGPLGLVIALVICVVGSFYTTSEHYATLNFKDGSNVTVACAPGKMRRLFDLRDKGEA